jgi:probable rRNA maturation factor
MEQCCLAALQQQQLLSLEAVSDIELSIQFLGTDAMADLNGQYRHKHAPTNVLSFTSGMPLMAAERGPHGEQAGGSLLLLGDLVLCPSVVATEAAQQGKSEHQHWAHLLVHGTLHLCGHDHECAEEAQAMEAMEIQILSGLGIPDPYSVIDPVIDPVVDPMIDR